MLGELGKILLTDTSAITGKNIAIVHALTDCVIASATDETLDSGSYAALALKAGDSIFGIFTAITLTSGTAVLYYR